jgi:hypothetical protein
MSLPHPSKAIQASTPEQEPWPTHTPRPGTAPAPAPTPDEALVKQLKALCHPDHWSQGQAASELAHELMVTLNATAKKGGRP